MSLSKLAHDVLTPGTYQSPSAEKIPSRSVALSSWPLESSSTLLAYVHKLVNSIQLPVSFIHERLSQHHIVTISFILRNKRTNISIEFSEWPGGVRATSLLCLLGIGLSLGSVLLYKLCSRIISPAVSTARNKKKQIAPNSTKPQTELNANSPETPDSGISTATTLTNPVSSSAISPDDDKSYSLRYRSHEPRPSYNSDTIIQYSDYHNYEQLNEVDQSGDLVHPHNKRQSRVFTPSVLSDQGFISGHYQSGERLSHYYSDHESLGHRSVPTYLSRAGISAPSYLNCSAEAIQAARGRPDHIFSPIPHAESRSSPAEYHDISYANSNGAFRRTSTPQPLLEKALRNERPFLRRNAYSRASDLSSSTDYSQQESRYSADNTDGLSFLNTSNSDLFERESVSNNSNINMEQIHQEICMIREEISEMNERVQVLSSRENLEEILMLTPNPLKDEEFGVPLEVRRRRHQLTRERHNSGSLSCNTSVEGDAKDNALWRRSYHHAGEYIWDYQSDLATDESVHFIAQRPLIQDEEAMMSDNIDYNSPTFDHVRKYIESCCNANITRRDDKPPKQRAVKSRTFNSITDMYIDDSLSEFGDYTLDGNFEMRNVPDGCYSNANTTMTSGDLADGNTLRKQFSLNQISTDCDKNGNRMDDSVVGKPMDRPTGVMDVEHINDSDQSICLECGSPSHKRRSRETASATSSRNSLASSGSGSQRVEDGKRASCPKCGHRMLEDADRDSVLQRNKRRKWQVMNIGKKINIFEYVEKHFKGETASVGIMTKGYHQIPRLLSKTQIRLIRADNYCALRAVVYQICVNNFQMMYHIGSFVDTIESLAVFDEPQYNFLKKWSFANRLPYDSDSIMDRIQDCLECFYTQMNKLSSLPTPSAREVALVELLNFDPEIDLKMMEAIKVLMMLKAIKMYESYMGLVQSEVSKPPVFVWLMYSRQSSQTPEALFTNHINPLGDISPAHQVELFLLGYTLGVKIEIVRPPKYGQDDFISHYPDDGADNFPTVYLVAEDDRHYHAITA